MYLGMLELIILANLGEAVEAEVALDEAEAEAEAMVAGMAVAEAVDSFPEPSFSLDTWSKLRSVLPPVLGCCPCEC